MAGLKTLQYVLNFHFYLHTTDGNLPEVLNFTTASISLSEILAGTTWSLGYVEHNLEGTEILNSTK